MGPEPLVFQANAWEPAALAGGAGAEASMHALPWAERPEDLACLGLDLAPGRVQLLGLPLRLDRDSPTPSLHPDEWARAGRFAQAADRRRFAQTREGLRQALGAALGLPPARVPLGVDARGKPQVLGGGVHFSVSHAGGLALVALSADLAVGVDLELAVPDDLLRGGLAQVLHPAEQEAWAVLAEGERAVAFLRLWVRKEAVLKALGVGLAAPLEGFAVGWAPGAQRVVAAGQAVWLLDLGLGFGAAALGVVGA